MVDYSGLAKRAGHLVRRTVEHEYPGARKAIGSCNKYLKGARPPTASHAAVSHQRHDEIRLWKDVKITPTQATVLAGMLVILVLICGAWSYIEKFVMTLAVVEAPAPPNYVEAEANKPAAEADSDSKRLLDQPETPAPTERTTASLRDTFYRIRTTPGSSGLLHGAGAYVLYKIAFIATLFLGAFVAANVTQNIIVCVVAGSVFASFVTARLNMAALHARIAVRQPNQPRVTFFRRVKGLTWVAARKTVFPIISINVVSRLSSIATQTPISRTSNAQICALAASIIAMLLCIPAKLVLIRQQASTLPFTDDCFVNLDTSFGVAAAQTDGDEPTPLTFCQAARSFRWVDVKHIIKMKVKITVVGIAFSLVLAPIVFGAIYALGIQGNM